MAKEINIMVYYPEKIEAQRELEKRIAEIHADAVIQYIDSLNCTREQKIALVNDFLGKSQKLEIENVDISM